MVKALASNHCGPTNHCDLIPVDHVCIYKFAIYMFYVISPSPKTQVQQNIKFNDIFFFEWA